ncbi:MAG: MBOAT family protein [Chitinophagaceae bacterium]|nr:MBOAT family protein [Chitinophagaceae bacterium]
MLFNSFSFLIFLPLVCILYYMLPHKFRWLLLLLSSCYFYMAFVPLYILILGFTIVVDYFAGIYIENSTGKRRKAFLVCSLIANIGVLAVFKYFNFINENLTSLMQSVGLVNQVPYLSILLPIGLSFHTFQAMSYTIEVYRGHQKAERHFGIYSLYVMFFPQLVAGPIERPQNILHQFYEKHAFDYHNIVEGARLILWGFFMKVVVADRLAIYVNVLFDYPDLHNGTSLMVAAIFFTFQIYCDFAGYSKIAVGSARILGFDLMNNFERPFFSKSPSEFWKRWHISLSTWFRDYLYIPLGGNKVPLARNCVNLAFTFTISGLWHGASWNFIIWGFLNGLYIVVDRLVNPLTKKWRNAASYGLLFRIGGRLLTFWLISLAFVFFRAKSLDYALIIITKIFTSVGELYIPSPAQLIFSLLAITILMLSEFQAEFMQSKYAFFRSSNMLVRNIAYIVVIFLIMLIGVFDGGQFIYFQF